MTSDKEKSPVDHFDDEREEAGFFCGIIDLAMLIAVGPIGLLLGLNTGERKIFLWGVGTSLLYVGALGIITTVSLPELAVNIGLEPYLTTVENGLVGASEYAEKLFSMPETYIVLFSIGAAIVVVGCYRVMVWEPEDENAI